MWIIWALVFQFGFLELTFFFQKNLGFVISRKMLLLRGESRLTSGLEESLPTKREISTNIYQRSSFPATPCFFFTRKSTAFSRVFPSAHQSQIRYESNKYYWRTKGSHHLKKCNLWQFVTWSDCFPHNASCTWLFNWGDYVKCSMM